MGNTQGKPVSCNDAVNLNHFRLLRVVGKGAFGKVRIVERKDTGLTFALKYIRKEEVVRSESVRNIIRERRMLEHLNHPFLCNLRYSFQDMEYIYIVVDLMNGGDLRFHISRKCFTEDAVRFWMAELGCALRYIHSQGIIHRDLKPDNVLLDSDGHVHLADFNVASDYRPGKPLTSKSGTLAYLAPEVYEGTGYTFEVDWWSLGVTFYECIYNKRPFEGRSQETLSESIKKAQPKYYIGVNESALSDSRPSPDTFSSPRSTLKPSSGNKFPPVFRPSSDKTNFDATYDLEELLLEEAPLEARARRQKPRAELREDATAKEIRDDELHRLIETMFEPFDYTLTNYQGNAADAIAAATNPEDCLPIATTTSGNTSAANSTVHARQFSQPDPSNRTHPSHYETSAQYEGIYYRAPPTENITSVSETLDPNDPASGPISPSPSNRVSGSPPPAPSFHRPLPNRHRGATRQMSKSGGVQMVLNEHGSWSELANTSGSAADGMDSGDDKGKQANGMLSFFSRKKGRDRSPKPTEPGVLGKEGARQIIS
ncbi:uncharacterized protein N7515_005493 [Penicillium bovifimosum]|uniref:non-specific serine/threonine protein kinase n=1 Tax=Penicillium bovifimosum TaxID=126998 RepID=A0A9W9KZX0_9EURO|nr:uncharacterized protein N7515_005493 [Penicillium bovifimosum]KAJ5129454.1 hypothetical protein N7515_005493 [Penicillium bovifimosum]